MKYKNTNEILIPFYNFIEKDIYITIAGYTNFSYIDNPFKEYRMRNNYSISFVSDGEGVLYIDKKKYIIKKGDIFLLPKNTKIKYYPLKKNWEYFWFDFNGEKSDLYCELLGFSADKYLINCDDISDIIYQCEMLTMKKSKDETVGYYEVLSAFYSIIDLLIKKITHSTEKISLEESIKNYIKLHYFRSSLTIKEICDNFNISHSYLCKLFKKSNDVSAKGYIIKLRLEKAKKLLLTTNLSVKQISWSVGFSDDAYFMRIFKNHLNITPTEYRKQS